jgi:hypothetical protein
MTLGPTHSFQSFSRNLGPQQQQQSSISRTSTQTNFFMNLAIDSDGNDIMHHRLRGNGKSNSRNERKDHRSFDGHGQNDRTKTDRERSPPCRKDAPAQTQKLKEINYADIDLCAVDLSEPEQDAKDGFKRDLDKYNSNKISYPEMMANVKIMHMNPIVVGTILCDNLDQKLKVREFVTDIFIELHKENLVKSSDLFFALKMLIKIAEDLVCDIPHVYKYIAEYCGNYFYKFLKLQFSLIESIIIICRLFHNGKSSHEG